MKSKLTCLILVILFPAFVSAQAQKKSDTITQYITRLQNDSLLHAASVSILVVDAMTKKIVASMNPNIALLPASTLKIITTGLSLLAVGPDYRFSTKLCYDGLVSIDSVLHGNVYIVGGGDPSFGSEEAFATPVDTVFSRWAQILKDSGINRIAGKMIADESFFEYEETPESWTWGNMGSYFGTCASGLMFFENTYKATLSSGTREGAQTTILSVYPEMPNAQFINKIKTGKLHSDNNIIIYNSHYSATHVFTGVIPPKQTGFVIKGSNKNASNTCMFYFCKYLNRYGIVTDNLPVVLTERIDSENRIVLATHNSPPLKEIAGIVNKKSNNLYAETLLKTIGIQKKQTSLYDSSFVAIQQMLNELNVVSTSFNMRDGSGLSRKNYASAQFFCDFLQAMYSSPAYDDYLFTLATPGDKGTFEKLLLNVPTRKRLHAKSGSMDGVRAYAGYCVNPSSTLIFAIIINNFNYKAALLQPKLEKLLELITQY